MISTCSYLVSASRRISIATMAATVAALAASAGIVPIAAQAKSASPAYGPKEAPIGQSYATWMGEWAQWAFGGPSATNPLLNLQACNTWLQPDPAKVWFLSANGPGTASVTCSVPSDLPIAITPGGIFDWKKPGEEAKLAEFLKTFPDSVRKPTLSVDGIKVDASKYLVTSPILTMKIVAPEFGPSAGPDASEVVMQAKGWMLVLKGLPAGQHKVSISDQLSNLDDNGVAILKNGKPTWLLSKVNYTLNVGARPVVAVATPTTTIAAPPAATTPPATTVAPTTPTATTLGPVLFADDFSNPSSGWLDDNGGGWTMGYVDGKYRIGVNPGSGGHAGPGHRAQPDLRNSRTEVDFELTVGDGAVAIHCYDASPEGTNTDSSPAGSAEPEFLYVGLSPKAGIGASVSIGGKRFSLGGSNVPAMTSAFRAMNRLVVECKGESGKTGNVRAFLNGVLILDARVEVMPSGDGIRFALEAFRGLPAKAEVVFDNMSVTQLP